METSQAANPASLPRVQAATSQFDVPGSRYASSITVPGVSTRVISRLTTFFPVAASTWSQSTTFLPARRSRPTYVCQEWCGTPHIGCRPSFIGREVRVTPITGAASIASSKKIS